MKENNWKQWLILIYLTKIKDKKLLDEVMKNIDEIKKEDYIIKLVRKLETSKDNGKKILSVTSEAKISHADVTDSQGGSADII